MSEVLVHVTRGELVENIHRGDVVVVNGGCEVIAKVGYANKVTYMRSSAKPIQACAVLESGAAEHFGLNEREIAVICASHYAEDFHTDAVASILKKIGLEEKAFLLGETYSLSDKTTSRFLKEGKAARKIYNNCSGKHAGMLALAMHMGYDIKSYDQLESPVQQMMLNTVAEFVGVEKEDINIGIDGCGVPVFGMPIYNMALSYAKMADVNAFEGARRDAVNKIINSMTRYPEMISGTGGFCSELMKATQGRIFGKLGADGVYCLGIRGKGIGLALKIEDGSVKALSCVVIETLKQLDELSHTELEMLQDYYLKENINTQGQKVGEMKSDFKLTFL